MVPRRKAELCVPIRIGPQSVKMRKLCKDSAHSLLARECANLRRRQCRSYEVDIYSGRCAWTIFHNETTCREEC